VGFVTFVVVCVVAVFKSGRVKIRRLPFGQLKRIERREARFPVEP
jgi:hypothetical protein